MHSPGVICMYVHALSHHTRQVLFSSSRGLSVGNPCCRCSSSCLRNYLLTWLCIIGHCTHNHTTYAGLRFAQLMCGRMCFDPPSCGEGWLCPWDLSETVVVDLHCVSGQHLASMLCSSLANGLHSSVFHYFTAWLCHVKVIQHTPE